MLLIFTEFAGGKERHVLTDRFHVTEGVDGRAELTVLGPDGAYTHDIATEYPVAKEDIRLAIENARGSTHCRVEFSQSVTPDPPAGS